MRILIADDHALVREGLQHVLRRRYGEIDIIEATTFSQALELVSGEDQSYDLAVVDLFMPDASGFEALQALRKKIPAVPIVVLSEWEQHEDIVRSFEAGANGFVPKSLPNNVMLSALDIVLAGGRYVPDKLLETATERPLRRRHAPSFLRGRFPNLGPGHPLHSLTPRQRRVLTLLAAGKSNKEIGRDLDLTESAVKSHVSKILRALDVNNRSKAIVRLEELGCRPDERDQ